MTQHVNHWLGAYHDGELTPVRRQQVAAHLQNCPTCLAELDALRSLSRLLNEEPALVSSISSQRFASQVRLRLPRGAVQPGWQWTLRLAWQALPALLIGGWAFIQALVLVAGLVFVGLQVGLGSQVLAQPEPLARLIGLFGLPGSAPSISQPGWAWIESFAQLLALQGGANLVVCLLLCGWLVGWWLNRREQVKQK